MSAGIEAMFLSALWLALLFLVPGLTAWLVWGHSLKKQLSLLETVYLILLSGLAVNAWAALILAEWGVFSLPLLSLILWGGSGAIVVWGYKYGRIHHPFHSLTWNKPATIGLLLLLGLALYLSPKPFEYVVGGRDHGIYVNTGVYIARHGRILVQDDTMAAVPPDSRAALIKPDVFVYRAGFPGPWSEGQRLSGLTIRDTDAGIFAPHAFHLYPALIAIFFAAGGIYLALMTTTFLALLGGLGVYFVAYRLFNQWVGLVALFLLIVSVTQMWFTKYPAAEIMIQAFFWGGLYVSLVMLETKNRYTAVLAGFLLGLLHLTKLDTVFIPISLAIFFLHLWYSGRFHKNYWYFTGTYILLSLHALLHAFFISTIYFIDHAVRSLLPEPLAQVLAFAAIDHPYPQEILVRLLRQNAAFLAVGLVLVAGSLFILYKLRQPVGKWLNRGEKYGRILQVSLAVALGIFLIAAWLIADIFQFSFWRPWFHSATLTSWYIPFSITLLSISGYLLLLATNRQITVNFALLLITFNILPLYLIGTGTSPDHFWSIRRFISVAFPAIFLFAAWFLFWLAAKWPYRRSRYVILTTVLLVLGWQLWQTTQPLASVVEYDGWVNQLDQFANQFSDEDILLFAETDGANRVTMPLWFLFDKRVFTIPGKNTQMPELATAVQSWQSDGRTVYWISTDGSLPPTIPDMTPVYQFTFPMWARQVETPTDHIPQEWGYFLATFDVYRMGSGEQANTKVASYNIGRDAALVDGAAVIENLPGLTPRAVVSDTTTLDTAVSGTPAELLILMGNGRKTPTPVSIYFNGELLDTVTVDQPVQLITLPLPPNISANTAQIRLTVPPTENADLYLDWIKLLYIPTLKENHANN